MDIDETNYIKLSTVFKKIILKENNVDLLGLFFCDMVSREAETRGAENPSGYLLTCKKNGNRIFLPATGYRNGTSFDDVGRTVTIGVLCLTKTMTMVLVTFTLVVVISIRIGAVATTGSLFAPSDQNSEFINPI